MTVGINVSGMPCQRREGIVCPIQSKAKTNTKAKAKAKAKSQIKIKNQLFPERRHDNTGHKPRDVIGAGDSPEVLLYASELLVLPPPSCKSRCPHAGEEVFTLILVLAIKFNILVTHYPSLAFFVFFLAFPSRALDYPFRLQDELPDLVSLAFLFGLDILPAQHTPTCPAADVAHGVRTGDQLSRNSLVSMRVWKITSLHVARAQARCCQVQG